MHSNLEVLDLGHNNIGDEGCIALSKNLPRLGVNSCYNDLSFGEVLFVFLSSLVNISCYLTSRKIGNTFCKEQSYIIISSAKVQGLIGKSPRGVGILL